RSARLYLSLHPQTSHRFHYTTRFRSRDQMHALASERIQVQRERGDQRLTLAGLHLGDLALVENDAGHELDVVVPLPQRALGRLTDRKSTRLNSSHVKISYTVFCWQKN